MKRNLLFMSVLASLFLVGCSQEDIAPDEGANGNGEATTSYMAVNLVSSDVLGTRATVGDYEDGTDIENGVKHVRFYFFNGVGGPVNVKTTASGTSVNYYDWNNDITGSGNPSDVERILSTIIVIDTKKGDGLPVRIAAVLNPTQEILAKGSMGISVLKEQCADFATADLTKKDYFVMFNSVYVQDKKDYSTTDIKEGNICKTDSAANKNPVKIYVERSVAKVSVALGSNVANAATADGKIALKDKLNGGQDLKVGGKQVYLKLGGWELAAETDKGRLVKKIDPTWERDWWRPNAHRTLWAINEKSAENVYDKSYEQISNSFGGTKYLYTNENAQKNDIDNTPGNAKNNTKVIVKGQLVDENGVPFTIVRHMGTHFADDPADFNNLKESILTVLENKEYFYYYKDGNNYTQISAADLDVVVPTLEPKEDSENNCYVYTQLNSTAAARTTWYKSTKKNPADNSEYQKIDVGEINNTLGGLKDPEKPADGYIIDRPLVWKNGMTYYYYEIRHLDGSNEIGVVRNHIYKTTITNIAGLGTPVYTPGEIIYPEKPGENDHYIAAQINILSWRVVKNDYDLEW